MKLKRSPEGPKNRGAARYCYCHSAAGRRRSGGENTNTFTPSHTHTFFLKRSENKVAVILKTKIFPKKIVFESVRCSS